MRLAFSSSLVNHIQLTKGSGILLIVGALLIAVSNSVVIPNPYRSMGAKRHFKVARLSLWGVMVHEN